jgi:hypothetical protein
MHERSRSVIAVTPKLRLYSCYFGDHQTKGGPNLWVERICQTAMHFGFPMYFLTGDV